MEFLPPKVSSAVVSVLVEYVTVVLINLLERVSSEGTLDIGKVLLVY